MATRNARLACLRSFFHFASLRHPEHAGLIQRVLAVPAKRTGRPTVRYLDRPKAEVLLAAPDLSTRTGRRDKALLAVALQTGLRVSELAGLRRQDVRLGKGGACPLHRQEQEGTLHSAHRSDVRPGECLDP